MPGLELGLGAKEVRRQSVISIWPPGLRAVEEAPRVTWATGGDSQVELSLVDKCQPGEEAKGAPGGAPASRFQARLGNNCEWTEKGLERRSGPDRKALELLHSLCTVSEWK